MNQEGDGCAGTALGAVLASIIWFIVVVNWFTADNVWHQQAAEHGAAHYDTKTGAWKWNDETEQQRGSATAGQAKPERGAGE